MRVWLDDRVAPPDEGWVGCRWPEDVIAHLQTGSVTELSLDHDLGDDPRTGYDVVVWIEEQVAFGTYPGRLPTIAIHSGNPVGRARMRAGLLAIERLALK